MNITPILEYWFGDLKDGMTTTDKSRLWFGADAQDDDEIRQRFGADVEAALGGELDHLAQQDEGSIALIILTDQMPRAIYRNTPKAFMGDAIALAVCQQGIKTGQHQRLAPAYRQFYYLPLEHSEKLADQDQSVSLFEDLCKDYPQHIKPLSQSLEYAIQHRDIIASYDRFPHRNAILGRVSTANEIRYLRHSKHDFGQSN